MIINQEKIRIWFKELEGHSRIELMCTLLDSCLPLEMRFLGTYLEYGAGKHYSHLMRWEKDANNDLLIDKSLNLSETKVRRRLCLFLALMHSHNRSVAIKMFEVLNLYEACTKATAENESEKSDGKIKDWSEKMSRNEMRLLLTMASLHPAFNFDQRERLRMKLDNFVSNCCQFKDCQSEEENPVFQEDDERIDISPNISEKSLEKVVSMCSTTSENSSKFRTESKGADSLSVQDGAKEVPFTSSCVKQLQQSPVKFTTPQQQQQHIQRVQQAIQQTPPHFQTPPFITQQPNMQPIYLTGQTIPIMHQKQLTPAFNPLSNNSFTQTNVLDSDMITNSMVTPAATVINPLYPPPFVPGVPPNAAPSIENLPMNCAPIVAGTNNPNWNNVYVPAEPIVSPVKTEEPGTFDDNNIAQNSVRANKTNSDITITTNYNSMNGVLLNLNEDVACNRESSSSINDEHIKDNPRRCFSESDAYDNIKRRDHTPRTTAMIRTFNQFHVSQPSHHNNIFQQMYTVPMYYAHDRNNSFMDINKNSVSQGDAIHPVAVNSPSSVQKSYHATTTTSDCIVSTQRQLHAPNAVCTSVTSIHYNHTVDLSLNAMSKHHINRSFYADIIHSGVNGGYMHQPHLLPDVNLVKNDQSLHTTDTTHDVLPMKLSNNMKQQLETYLHNIKKDPYTSNLTISTQESNQDGQIFSSSLNYSPRSSPYHSPGHSPMAVRKGGYIDFKEHPRAFASAALWLKSVRLHKYSKSFEGYTFQMIKDLDDESLETLGLTVGARNKFKQCVNYLINHGFKEFGCTEESEITESLTPLLLSPSSQDAGSSKNSPAGDDFPANTTSFKHDIVEIHNGTPLTHLQTHQGNRDMDVPTETSSDSTNRKYSHNVTCYNCGLLGHYGDECHEQTMEAQTYSRYAFHLDFSNTKCSDEKIKTSSSLLSPLLTSSETIKIDVPVSKQDNNQKSKR